MEDANPLAQLISQVKVRPIPAPVLLEAIDAALVRLPMRTPKAPPVVNRTYWFTEAASGSCPSSASAIDGESDSAVRNFLRVCMSAAVRRASLADPRVSVPVKLRRDQFPPDHWLHEKSNARVDAAATHDAIADFRSIHAENARRVGSLADNGITSAEIVVTSRRGAINQIAIRSKA